MRRRCAQVPEAVYATRGRARAVILAERVVVPLSVASGDNRRMGDVILQRDETPDHFGSALPLVAHCAEAVPRRPLDAWETLDAVSPALVLRLLSEFRRIEDERIAIMRWRVG